MKSAAAILILVLPLPLALAMLGVWSPVWTVCALRALAGFAIRQAMAAARWFGALTARGAFFLCALAARGAFCLVALAACGLRFFCALAARGLVFASLCVPPFAALLFGLRDLGAMVWGRPKP